MMYLNGGSENDYDILIFIKLQKSRERPIW